MTLGRNRQRRDVRQMLFRGALPRLRRHLRYPSTPMMHPLQGKARTPMPILAQAWLGALTHERRVRSAWNHQTRECGSRAPECRMCLV
jgi:hypothetical protein